MLYSSQNLLSKNGGTELWQRKTPPTLDLKNRFGMRPVYFGATNLDASEYKGVVLGLIFLKYISDRFEDKYNQLVADGDGFEEDRDEYTSEGIFFVPAGARWSDVSAKAHDPEIGQVIDDAMRAIEKENARLKDILPKNFARPELDKRRLGEVVDLFTNIK